VGIRTLDSFRGSLSLVLGNKTQGNERLDEWINDGVEELFGLMDLEGRRTSDTFQTVAAQEEYVLPANCLAILVLSIGKRLLWRPIENYQLLDNAKTGKPRIYTRVDRTLFLHPIPNDVFTVSRFFIKSPTRLTGVDDVTELPPMFDRVVHLLASKNALLDVGMEEKATTFYQTAVNLLRTLPTEEWLESAGPTDGGVQVARSIGDLQGR
jgi:hypothetical protein